MSGRTRDQVSLVDCSPLLELFKISLVSSPLSDVPSDLGSPQVETLSAVATRKRQRRRSPAAPTVSQSRTYKSPKTSSRRYANHYSLAPAIMNYYEERPRI